MLEASGDGGSVGARCHERITRRSRMVRAHGTDEYLAAVSIAKRVSLTPTPVGEGLCCTQGATMTLSWKLLWPPRLREELARMEGETAQLRGRLADQEKALREAREECQRARSALQHT